MSFEGASVEVERLVACHWPPSAGQQAPGSGLQALGQSRSHAAVEKNVQGLEPGARSPKPTAGLKPGARSREPGAESCRTKGLPVDEALRIARQIAEALEAAHEKAVIHRDLKPANIVLTAQGQVKVLDFGLAKALNPVVGSDLTNSATLTLAATQAGVILGTAAYMAPEQAKGRAADKRCDIWPFGCVLYEMLTGTQAFEGEHVSDTLATVLKSDPDWDLLPADVAPAIRRLLRRCLAKDPKARIPDIAVSRYDIDDVVSGAVSEIRAIPAGEVRARLSRVRHVGAIAGVALAAGAIAGFGMWMLLKREPPALVRLTATPSTRPVGDGSPLPDVAMEISAARFERNPIWVLQKIHRVRADVGERYWRRWECWPPLPTGNHLRRRRSRRESSCMPALAPS